MTAAPDIAADRPGPPVVTLAGVGQSYGDTRALDAVTLDIPAGRMVGLIGPDGVGKSSLMALIAGARAVQEGRIEVLGGDIARARHRNRIMPRIAYMPQGLGRNLYPTLSVFENVDFFGRLFGHARAERHRRIADLLHATGLAPFADRPAGKLSGGMKQKLGLCCALIHDPDLLVLDEPTTGVDPLSRRQFWDLIDRIRADRPGMSVIVATAYMEEAARFDWIVAMNAGRVLATGSPAEIRAATATQDLDAAFIALLPEGQRGPGGGVTIPPRSDGAGDGPAIAAEGLTRRFGDFTAVEAVDLRIGRGEIFGFLGSNGCGKTTTMKMLTGLLEPTAGRATLFGHPIDARDLSVRRRIGYMSQSFSLYGELTVRQNLELHARLFGLPETGIPARVAEMADSFGLSGLLGALPDALPLGMRQRLSLAVAMIHGPDILILDEPTSGVDPVARDDFWRILARLSREAGVTIFISTHFMNEAERCDRVSLMHAGRVLVTDSPAAIREGRGTATLEDAFIAYLEAAEGGQDGASGAAAAPDGSPAPATIPEPAPAPAPARGATGIRAALGRRFSFRRMFSYTRREAIELRRDPIRMTLAMAGSLVLMLVMGYGINLDVESLRFAALDFDQTATSRDYIAQISGSRYFTEQPPIRDHADLDARMRSGELSLAIEIPPGFAADLARGRAVEVGAWIDGAMPSRAETVRGYVQGIHAWWLTEKTRTLYGDAAVAGRYAIETRFRYNPDVKSLVAMVPAVMPLLLVLIPAMLAALSVVREKELGSIVNLYVTPVTRLEFLLGKQIAYVALAMLNFALLTGFAIHAFRVPFTGSLAMLTLSALAYVTATTGIGLVISSFMKSQIAAIFGTALLTLIPATQFSGMIDPVSALEGAGAAIGHVYPTTYFITVARGTFSKALGWGDLLPDLLAMVAAIPVLTVAAVLLLRKQAR